MLSPYNLVWWFALAFAAVAYLTAVPKERKLKAATPAGLPTSLHASFNPRANGLNLIRLVLASLVIVWHSYPLTGTGIGYAPLRQLAEEVPVDGFFAISGFLIAGSWLRNPDARSYVSARFLRIFPAFWVCLVVTAFVIAPLAIWLSSAEKMPANYVGNAFEYIVKNSSLRIYEWSIAGTPHSAPFPDAWNGSLWTLRWEFLCYVGVLALGLVGLVKRNVVLFLYAAVLLITVLVDSSLATFPEAGSWTRFSLMFLSGMVVLVLSEWLPRSPALTAGAFAITLASMWLDDYRIVGSFFLAYGLISLGSFVTSPRLQLRNDISYGVYIYAFPVQQLVALIFAAHLSVVFMAMVALPLTIILALLSWFWIEKPALRLKKVGKTTPALAEVRSGS